MPVTTLPSPIQAQIDAITGGNNAVFKEALGWFVTGSTTVGTSYADLSNVANQTVTFPASGDYIFLLCCQDPFPAAATNDELYMQVMIDNVASGEFPVITFNADSAQRRMSFSSVITIAVTAGDRNIRVQMKSLNGGRITVDSAVSLQLIML